ncbi:MAG TPA: dual specificity protein phosphatase family protein [Nitrososphaerales archaeon]|nr:dual specificity protein phosphatase family protein [Nitrososphaerales archaeon]
MGTGGLFLRKLRARVANEPTGFVWVEKGRLAGSGYPASRGQLEWLIGQGVSSILTLTMDPLPKELVEGLPVELGHIPLEDHLAPDAESLDKAANFIIERLKAGKTVLVHCLAGEGRTGCVLAAYLILTRRVGGDEAISVLRAIKPSFVEYRQEAAVRNYADLAERRTSGT